MLALHYKLTSFIDILQKLAALFDTYLLDKTLNVPEKYGTGFCKLLDFNNELHASIYNFKLHEDIVQREKDSLEYYETVAKQNYPQYVNEGDWDYYLLLKGNAKKQ